MASVSAFYPCRWSLQFFLHLLECCLKRTKLNKKEAGVSPFNVCKICPWLGGSPGLVVKGGDSCAKGCEFKSRHGIPDGHFFTFICCKNVMCVWKDQNKLKRGRGWPIFGVYNWDWPISRVQQILYYTGTTFCVLLLYYTGTIRLQQVLYCFLASKGVGAARKCYLHR